MDFETFIDKIGGEAESLRKKETALDIEFCYLQSILAGFRVAYQQPRATPFEARILKELTALQKRTPEGAFKRHDIIVAVELAGIKASEWTLTMTLNSLEKKGLVYRPRGPRTKFWAVHLA